MDDEEDVDGKDGEDEAADAGGHEEEMGQGEEEE